MQSENNAVESEDINVLVLLTVLSPTDRENYFLKPFKGKIPKKAYSSRSLEKALPNCKQHILVLHAFTGCDTTSAFSQRGKNMFAIFLKTNSYDDECKDINYFLRLVLHAHLLSTIPKQ